MTHLPSSGVSSRTRVYAEAGWVVAECACGWYHRFRPARDIPASRIWDYALDHSSGYGAALSTTDDSLSRLQELELEVSRLVVERDAAERAHGDKIAELLEALADIYKPEGVGIWLLNKHKLLGGRTACEVLREPGGLERIWQLIDQLRSGAYV